MNNTRRGATSSALALVREARAGGGRDGGTIGRQIADVAELPSARVRTR